MFSETKIHDGWCPLTREVLLYIVKDVFYSGEKLPFNTKNPLEVTAGHIFDQAIKRMFSAHDPTIINPCYKRNVPLGHEDQNKGHIPDAFMRTKNLFYNNVYSPVLEERIGTPTLSNGEQVFSSTGGSMVEFKIYERIELTEQLKTFITNSSFVNKIAGSTSARMAIITTYDTQISNSVYDYAASVGVLVMHYRVLFTANPRLISKVLSNSTANAKDKTEGRFQAGGRTDCNNKIIQKTTKFIIKLEQPTTIQHPSNSSDLSQEMLLGYGVAGKEATEEVFDELKEYCSEQRAKQQKGARTSIVGVLENINESIINCGLKTEDKLRDKLNGMGTIDLSELVTLGPSKEEMDRLKEEIIARLQIINLTVLYAMSDAEKVILKNVVDELIAKIKQINQRNSILFFLDLLFWLIPPSKLLKFGLQLIPRKVLSKVPQKVVKAVDDYSDYLDYINFTLPSENDNLNAITGNLLAAKNEFLKVEEDYSVFFAGIENDKKLIGLLGKDFVKNEKKKKSVKKPEQKRLISTFGNFGNKAINNISEAVEQQFLLLEEKVDAGQYRFKYKDLARYEKLKAGLNSLKEITKIENVAKTKLQLTSDFVNILSAIRFAQYGENVDYVTAINRGINAIPGVELKEKMFKQIKFPRAYNTKVVTNFTENYKEKRIHYQTKPRFEFDRNKILNKMLPGKDVEEIYTDLYQKDEAGIKVEIEKYNQEISKKPSPDPGNILTGLPEEFFQLQVLNIKKEIMTYVLGIWYSEVSANKNILEFGKLAFGF